MYVQDITLVQKALHAADASVLPGEGTVPPRDCTAAGASSSPEEAMQLHNQVKLVAKQVGVHEQQPFLRLEKILQLS